MLEKVGKLRRSAFLFAWSYLAKVRDSLANGHAQTVTIKLRYNKVRGITTLWYRRGLDVNPRQFQFLPRRLKL